MAGDTHTVMPKKLAQALMDAGMQHFKAGGLVGALGAGNNFQAEGVNNIANINQQYGQQQNVYNQQQALASQLLAQTQGQGPAQNLIAAQGAQNAAQQSALMASARGASANPAAIARQAAIQGQQGQQQVLNAQAAAQLQSQNALAQQQATMASQALQGQQIGQQAQANVNALNAGVAAQNATANQGILGGLIGGASSALGGLFYEGGEVPQHLAMGGYAMPFSAMGTPMAGAYGMGSMGQGLGGLIGKGLGSLFSGAPKPQMPASGPGSQEDLDSGGLLTAASQQQENMQSGLPLYPNAAPMDPSMSPMAKGGMVSFGQMLAGGKVPGKAQVKGNSPKNDTVPTMLSPGEVVIPRTVMNSEDAPEKAAEFIRHLRSKKGYKGVQEARKAK